LIDLPFYLRPFCGFCGQISVLRLASPRVDLSRRASAGDREVMGAQLARDRQEALAFRREVAAQMPALA
jgi:hypothetical protein